MPLTVTVDGVPNAPLETVDPDGGSIIAEWDILVDGLLRWIAEQLVARSPVVSGAYRRGHTLYVDGTEVPIGGDIRPSADAEEYVFLNPVPYARKIEVGKTKAGRAFVIQVPNHIYERTAKDARARFGNQAKIRISVRSRRPAPIASSTTRRRGISSTAGEFTKNRSNARIAPQAPWSRRPPS